MSGPFCGFVLERWSVVLAEMQRAARRLRTGPGPTDHYVRASLFYLHEFTLFYLEKKERSMESAVGAETGGAGQGRQAPLGRQKIPKRFSGSGAVSDSFDDHAGRVVTLRDKERGERLRAFLIALDEVLHARMEAVGEKPVDEDGAFDGAIRGADEVGRVPSIRPQERNMDVMESQLGGDQADVAGSAGDEDRVESGRVQQTFAVSVGGFAAWL